jgi:hypothetical protein
MSSLIYSLAKYLICILVWHGLSKQFPQCFHSKISLICLKLLKHFSLGIPFFMAPCCMLICDLIKFSAD